MATDWNEWFGHEHPPALQKIWVLQTTWTDLSVELQKIVSDLWRYRELGNDNYVYKTSIIDLAELQDAKPAVRRWDGEKVEWVEGPLDVQPLINYLEEKGVGPEEEVWLHLWW